MPQGKWFARLFLHLGDMLGRGLGETGEAVATAEADHELLRRIDIFTADWAFFIVRPLHLGDVIGRGFGEIGETVPATEVD